MARAAGRAAKLQQGAALMSQQQDEARHSAVDHRIHDPAALMPADSINAYSAGGDLITGTTLER